MYKELKEEDIKKSESEISGVSTMINYPISTNITPLALE